MQDKTITLIKGKSTGMFTLEQATKVQTERKSIALPLL